MSEIAGVEIRVNSDGSEQDFAADIERAIVRAAQGAGKEIASILRGAFDDVGRDASKKLSSGLDNATQAAGVTVGAVETLQGRIAALIGTTEQFGARAKENYDPAVFLGFQTQLQLLQKLQQDLIDGQGEFTSQDLRELDLQYRAFGKQLTTLSTEFVQVEKTAREAESNISRENAAQLRLRAAQESRARGENVAATQRAQAQETAAIRAATQQQVAATQAAARRRVAALEFAGRAIRTIERGLRTVFENTARVIGRSFDAIGNIASSTARGIGNAFRRGNRDITNNYEQSWSENSRIVEGSISRQETTINNFAARARSALSGIGVGGALGLGGAAAGGAFLASSLRAGFNRFATIQESTRALTVLLGDAEEAATLLDDTLEVVLGTPFGLELFADAAAQLTAFGLEADRIPGVLEAIGDAAAIKGGDAPEFIGRLVDVFGRIQSQGRLTGNELQRLQETGVDAARLLGNQLGVTAEEARSLASAGEIGAEAIEMLVLGITEGTDGINGTTRAFGGLAKSLGETLRGSIANFGNARARLGVAIIAPFNDAAIAIIGLMTKALNKVIKLVEGTLEPLTESAGFRAFVAGIQRLGDNIDEVFAKLAPVIRSVADAAIIFGSALAGLFVARNAGVAVGVLRFALRRLVTPLNVAFALVTALSFAIRRSISQFPEIGEAFSAVGNALRDSLSALSSAFGEVFKALRPAASALRDLLGRALDNFAGLLQRVVVPALERFAGFVSGSVVPAIERFANVAARFIREDLGPGIARGFELAGEAVGVFVGFIRSTIVPVVIPAVTRLRDIAVEAFSAIQGFVVDTLAPAIGRVAGQISEFVQSVVGTVPGAIRELAGSLRDAFNERSFGDALSAFRAFFDEVGLIAAVAGVAVATAFFNPLAGLGVLIGGSLAVGLGPELVDRIRPLLQRVVDAINNFFSADNLAGVGVGILRAIERVGRAIGGIVSDPRFLAAIAAIAAAGVAAAGAFAVGFVRGVAENIPDIVSGLANALGEAFSAAVRAVVTDPSLLVPIAAIFTGAALLSRLRTAGRVAGATIAAAIGEGAATGARPGLGQVGLGGSRRDLVSSLFGTPAQLQARLGAQFDQIDLTLTRRLQGLRGITERFQAPLPTAGRNITQQLQDQNRSLKGLVQQYGAANVAGQAFREGLGNIRQGLRLTNLRSGQLRLGLEQIGTGLRLAGRQAFQAAGAALGAVFISSFASAALFSDTASGSEQFTAGAGLLATFATTAALTTIPVAAAAVGIGALAGAFQESGRRARESEDRIQSLIGTLEQFDDPRSREAIEAGLEEGIRNLTADLRSSLLEAGLDLPTIAELIETGNLDVIESRIKAAFDTGDFATAIALARVVGELEASAAGAEELAQILNGIDSEAGPGLTVITDRARDLTRELTEAFNANTLTEAGRALQQSQVNQYLEFLTGRAEEATQALRELNEARVAEVRGQINDLRGDLSEAQRAANEAREALTNFLQGDSFNLDQVTDRAIIQIDQIGQSLGEAFDPENVIGTADQARLDEKFREIAGAAISILQEGVNAGEILSSQDAAEALAPLIAAGFEVGGEAGSTIVRELNKLIDEFEDPEFEAAVTAALEADDAIEELETLIAEQEVILEGLLQFDEDQAKKASRDAADAAAREARSPAVITNFARSGKDVMGGLAGGIDAGRSLVVTAALRTVAEVEGALRGIRGFDTGSPSKVTFRIGADVSEGLARGIASGAASVSSTADRLGQTAVGELGAATLQAGRVGRDIGKAIADGIIESGPSVIGSISSIVQEAIGSGLTAAQQSSAVGSQIARALFAGQGQPGFPGGPGGGQEIALQQEFLAVAGVASAFGDVLDRFSEQIEGGLIPTFSIATEIGRELTGSFLAGGAQIRSYTDSLLAAGRPLSSVVFETKAWRDQLIAGAQAAGATAAEINTMVDQLGLSDAAISRWVRTVEESERAATAATAAYLALPRGLRELSEATGASIDQIRGAIRRLGPAIGFGIQGLENLQARGVLQGLAQQAGVSQQALAIALRQAGTTAVQLAKDFQALGISGEAASNIIKGFLPPGLATDLGLSSQELRNALRALGLSQDQLSNILSEAQFQDLAGSLGVTAEAFQEILRTSGKTVEQIEAAVNALGLSGQAATQLGLALAAAANVDPQLGSGSDEPEPEPPPTVLPPPVFRDLIINTPAGDPEAVALATANKVAYSVRR